jgi:hypothetical protein
MKTELIIDVPLIEIQRDLRRKNARLLRAIPRHCHDPRGRRADGWVITYIEESK